MGLVEDPRPPSEEEWRRALRAARSACRALGLRGDDLEDAARDAALEMLTGGDSRRWAALAAARRASKPLPLTDKEPTHESSQDLLCAALSIRRRRLSAYAVRRVLGDSPQEAAERVGYRGVRNAEWRFRREMRRMLDAEDAER